MATILHKYQAEYERFVAATTSDTTCMRYSRSLDAFFDYFPEKTEPGHFTQGDVDAFKAYRRKKGCTAKTTNYDLQAVRAFWNWMIRKEITAYNPASAVPKLRELEPKRESLTEEEQERVYAACLNNEERILIHLALTTGLRCKTLCELERSDFDLNTLKLTIPAEKMKSKKSLVLPIVPELAELIAIRQGKIFGAWALTTDALSRRFNMILQRVGITLRGLRTARRTVATTLLRNGADVRLVRDILAHANISTTNKYLTPATEDEMANAINNLPGRRKA